MRIRNNKNAKDILNSCKFLINNPNEYKGDSKKMFGNNNPIHIEIGMGKGSFLLESALNNPNINYVGIEKYDTIVAIAIEKITPYELHNLKIIKCDALELSNIFNKEIDLIYLNFSDPWPKEKHAKRRLTSPIFLNIYDEIFKKEKVIKLKTDNLNLFNYSIESIIKYGYEIIEQNNDYTSEILTEYEKKFVSEGITINYLHAIKM